MGRLNDTSVILSQYDCVGFDMDHTLCRYNLETFYAMEYEALAKYLVKEKGYDKELKRPLLSDGHFLLKGLLLDVERGNLLKLSSSGTILVASHGTMILKENEITSIYGRLHSNDMLRDLSGDLVSNTEGLITRKYRFFKDYFDTPAALMCARIVDNLDRKNGGPLDKYSFWRDVLCGLVDMFSRENLKLNRGGYYPKIRADPSLYMYQCSERVKNWLKDLHKRQVTFLVSGSDPEYVDTVAKYCLGDDWKEYFDFVVCSAKKPGFFSSERKPAFKKFSTFTRKTRNDEEFGEDIDLQRTLEANCVYVNGNWSQLRESMAQFGDLEDEATCIYIGDNLVQDVLAPHKHGGLDTIAIVEEMAAEGMAESSYSHPAADFLKSDPWASFFYHCHPFGSDSTVSGPWRMNTLWSSVIRNHSRMCVPSVDVLAQYPINHAFPVFSENSSGFFPGDPVVLQ